MREFFYLPVLLVLISVSCSTDSEPEIFGDEPFYIAENGITVKCPFAPIGKLNEINGAVYEAVDKELLRQRIREDADLTPVCTTPVQDMSYLFARNESFNQSIGNWDMSRVTDVRGMFLSAKSFDQPVGFWDMSHVKDMSAMFEEARSFNQDISDWNISNVE